MAESLGLFQHHGVLPKRVLPATRPGVAYTAGKPLTLPAARSAAVNPVRTPAATGPADELSRRVAMLTEENRALRQENQTLQARLIAVLNWMLTNFRGKYPLPENFMSKVQLTPLTEDFALHPDVVELLKITPEEEQNINDVLAYARKYLSDIEAAIITVTNPRPDKAILNIPTFAEDGKALQQDLYDALQVTLGANRFDRFLKVSEPGLKSSFYQFGEASRTMVFELVYEDGQEMPQLKIKDGWVVELGPNMRQVTATESFVTNLPSQYLNYLAWLPDYVAMYAAP